MRKRDMFYYIYESDKKEYVEIVNLIMEIMGLSYDVTEEHEIFLKDFYFRLLFRIAILEKRNEPIEKIVEEFGELFSIEKIKEIKSKYVLVIDKIKDKISKFEKGVKI